jgi:hypothetical protein
MSDLQLIIHKLNFTESLIGLRMWGTIIFTHFQAKFLRNLASEIINFSSKYVVQLLRKLPVLFRASDTSTYAQKIVFSRRL